MAKTTKPKTKTPPTRKATTPKAAAKAPKAPKAPKAAAPAPAPTAEMPRWRDLTTEDLRAMYREVVGRETLSTDRAYGERADMVS